MRYIKKTSEKQKQNKLLCNDEISFSFTMKLLVLFSILIVCLLSPTFGLQCYRCNNFIDGQSCKTPNITICGVDSRGVKESQIYCGKSSMVGTKGRFQYCNGNCSVKTCISLEEEQMCESSNTFELPADASGTSGTAFCCQGDLCNSSGKLSNQIKDLLFAVVFSCVYSLVGFLLN